MIDTDVPGDDVPEYDNDDQDGDRRSFLDAAEHEGFDPEKIGDDE